MNRKKVRILLRQIYDSSLYRKREIIKTGNEENLSFLILMKDKSSNILEKLDPYSKEYLLLSKIKQINLECILYIQTKPNSNTF